MKVLVTGGAGFIGSHLVDNLVEKDFSITVLDNLSSGSLENIQQWIGSKGFAFIRGDLLSREEASRAVEGCEVVFHLAANPEVRVGSISPEIHYRQNIEATFNLLEAVRRLRNLKAFIFTSSSTVYGEPSKIPTPEDYTPLKPISIYGASKLACETLITSYAYTYGFRAVIYRLANVVGPRSRHGVIYDFIQKLKANPYKLEILGDGTQTKSYLHVSDCVEAMLLGLEKANSQVEVFNVGSEDQLNVKRIAEMVAEEMGQRNVKFKLTGGVNGGRGWKGDVKNMLLDIGKLKNLGWKLRYNSEESVKLAVKQLISETLWKQ